MNLDYWLSLSNARNLSPWQCARLREHFGGAKEICRATGEELKALGIKPEAIAELHKPDTSLLKSEYLWAEQPNQFILSFEDFFYPPLLKTIPDPPPVLFIRGDITLLSKPQIAIVGSRNPSSGGCKTAAKLATELAEAGLIITSGLALGIDGAAHLGALEAKGSTIAVFGSGLDEIYPRRHKNLAKDISVQGALISEFSPKTPPLAAHFPRRNRIISGLCLGVCVVEAALRSGSLITARLAADQGREVFAVPGSIYNPLTQGCHTLIQNGAKLTADTSDILIELKVDIKSNKIVETQRSPLKLDSSCHQLLQCAGFEMTTIDQLVESSGWSVSRVSQVLAELELQGYIHKVPGGYSRE